MILHVGRGTSKCLMALLKASSLGVASVYTRRVITPFKSLECKHLTNAYIFVIFLSFLVRIVFLVQNIAIVHKNIIRLYNRNSNNSFNKSAKNLV